MFKLFFSIYAISILILSLLSGADLQYNLLKNGGFELKTDNWDSAGSGVSITTDSFNGKYALQYTDGGTGQTTDQIPVADGKTKYILNGYYKNIGSIDGMWLGITMLDKNGKNIGEFSTSLQQSSSYKAFELNTTPVVNTKYLSFWTWSDSKSGGKTLIDELRLRPKNYDITPCNILLNPDFEKDTKSWDTYGVKVNLVNNSYKGNKAIALKDAGLDQTSQQIVGFVDTYTFNGYYKTIDNPAGTWVGLNFYDKDYNLLFSKSLTLKNSLQFSKFSISGTSNKKTYYIQAWAWSDSNNNKGEVILDELKVSSSKCYTHVLPSSLPPGGLSVDKVPQFVVIGFDDNTKSEGIDWALNLFKDRKNADGSEARVSFYLNTKGLKTWIEDDPQKLKDSMIRLKNSSHEMGNHTRDHHEGKTEAEIRAFTKAQWNTAVSSATNDLVTKIGNTNEDIKGFRSPYLVYNQQLLEELKDENFLYDCSIEEGYSTEFDGTNFRWPYQLDNGSPGHNESWYGNPSNPDHVVIKPVNGLWELPNHVLMIPKDSECAKYGIPTGLWDRIVAKFSYLSDFKITGFDYNLWNLIGVNKAEFLGILKYNLDLRLKGNRAPLMIGAHTQYYVGDWASSHAPNATAKQMREAIKEFIDYALSKKEVRIRPAADIINWCSNPTPIN